LDQLEALLACPREYFVFQSLGGRRDGQCHKSGIPAGNGARNGSAPYGRLARGVELAVDRAQSVLGCLFGCAKHTGKRCAGFTGETGSSLAARSLQNRADARTCSGGPTVG
jgi:hypothetical protein